MLDMTPTDPHLVEGSLLEFNCTVDSKWSRSSDLYFTYQKFKQQKQIVREKYYSVIDSNTLTMQYPNISRSFDSARFVCHTKDGTVVDQMQITVDSKCCCCCIKSITDACR